MIIEAVGEGLTVRTSIERMRMMTSSGSSWTDSVAVRARFDLAFMGASFVARISYVYVERSRFSVPVLRTNRGHVIVQLGAQRLPRL